MKKNLCAIAVASAFALTACGGSGGGGGSAETPDKAAEVVVAKLPADLVFVNIPTNSRKFSVVPGARDVETLAFRVEGLNAPVEQMVILSTSTVPPSVLFKNVKLIFGTNDEVYYSASYSVRFDDKNGKIVVDFTYQWVPHDTGTYSVFLGVNPEVKPKTAFDLEIVDVQLHDAGKTVAFDPKGGEFTVEPVAGLELPVVTTNSPAAFMATVDLGGGQEQEMGSFKVTCSEKSTAVCSFETAKFHFCGMSEPMLVSADGRIFRSWRSGYPDYDTSAVYTDRYSILPGKTEAFTIWAAPYSKDLQLNVVDMGWVVGEEAVKVSPLVSPAAGSASLLSAETKACPNVLNGKG